jgi:antitoxin YefM
MTINASEARAKLFPLIQQVNEDATPVRITSKAGNAVLISESEYEGLLETLYLMSSPKNHIALLESIDELRSGGGFEFTGTLSEVLDTPLKPLRAAKKISASKRRPEKRTKVRVASK